MLIASLVACRYVLDDVERMVDEMPAEPRPSDGPSVRRSVVVGRTSKPSLHADCLPHCMQVRRSVVVGRTSKPTTCEACAACEPLGTRCLEHLAACWLALSRAPRECQWCCGGIGVADASTAVAAEVLQQRQTYALALSLFVHSSVVPSAGDAPAGESLRSWLGKIGLPLLQGHQRAILLDARAANFREERALLAGVDTRRRLGRLHLRLAHWVGQVCATGHASAHHGAQPPH